MGAGASTVTAEHVALWSKDDVAARVSEIGEAFEPYSDIAVRNGVDGQTLLALDNDDLAELGVTMKAHRKIIRNKLQALYSAQTQSPAAAHRRASFGTVENHADTPLVGGSEQLTSNLPSLPDAAGRRRTSNPCRRSEPSAAASTDSAVMVQLATSTSRPPTAAACESTRCNGAARQLFMSYSRGEHSTPFARDLKAFLQTRGFAVWMDEESIVGGANFMSAIGDAIKASCGVIAVIDEKFTTSTYCNNEVAMAQGNGLPLFPILLGGMLFAQLPNGLQYMLASTNIVSVADTDADGADFMEIMCEQISATFGVVAAPHHLHEAGVNTANAPAETRAPDKELQTLAPVPPTVPDAPCVICERSQVVSAMVNNLLGFLGTGAVSMSSVRNKSRLSSHACGGAGKTTLATMVVRHEMVRRSFERIAWVSVGQTPNIAQMQRLLYAQLTDEALEDKSDVEPELQLKLLQGICKGKRWLVVLDDVWDAGHEEMLNCIDPAAQAKLLVTTRIRKLLKGCDEISLDVLTRDEAVDLLLRTGCVESSDEVKAPAQQIVRLCGSLPLFVCICGSFICDHDGPAGVHAIEKLLTSHVRDELAHTDDEDEGVIAQRVLGMSLSLLKDVTTESAMQALAVCPDDVPLTMETVALVWGACVPEQLCNINVTQVRKVCTQLLDRKLLAGSVANGVFLHDIVREFLRTRFVDNHAIREKQLAIVEALVAAAPADELLLHLAEVQSLKQDNIRETTLEQHLQQSLLTSFFRTVGGLNLPG